MKEQFRDKSFRDDIKIKLESRNDHWIASASEVIDHADQIIDEYSAQHITMTLRQMM